jgi:hypothetical protein
MKRVVLAVVLVACFVIVAMAQDHRQPATVGEYSGLSQVRTDMVQSGAAVVRCAKVTGYYYYSGNFDSTSLNANGLDNEDDTKIFNGSQVYQPFSVVAAGEKKHLRATGLCVNSLDTAGAGIDNPTPYEVRFGAQVGSGGTLVCKGKAVSSDDPTGRSGFGITEYTHAVKISKCKLAGSAKTGTQYHMNVTPQCFKNNVCSNARYFESTDDSNLNHIGPATNKDFALWNSIFFGENWMNPHGPFGPPDFGSFSAGVTGRLVK